MGTPGWIKNIYETLNEKGLSDYDIIRIELLIAAGFLFSGSTSAWNSLGYLDPYAWVLEWTSVILAFFDIIVAAKTYKMKNLFIIYLLLSLSALFACLSLVPAINAPLPKLVNPRYFLMFGLPAAALGLVVYALLRKGFTGKNSSIVLLATVLIAIMSVSYLFYTVSSTFPTDEALLDMYGAHLFLVGYNPYNPALMSGAFTYYHFPLNYLAPITPLTTGGIVNSLTYPTLSFLYFAPAVVYGIPPALMVLPLYALPILLVWSRGYKEKKWLQSSLIILPFLSIIVYTYQGGSADTDVLWALFVMCSYCVLPKVKLSGVLYGLSLSVKQIPVLIAPFLVYFILKEYGWKNALSFGVMAILAFLVLNGYFLLLNPGYFVHSMLMNEFSPLIGIGYGFTQLSFLGIIPVGKTFFTGFMLTLMVVFIVLYIAFYRKIKFTFYAFPVILFLFNYRLFVQYLYYWLILILIPVLDLILIKEKNPVSEEFAVEEKIIPPFSKFKKEKWAVLAIVLILVGGGTMAFHFGVQNQNKSFIIENVKVISYNNSGYINSLNVSIEFISKQSSTSPVYFRIIQPGTVINGNMYLWLPANNLTLHSGSNTWVKVIPEYPQFALNPNKGFRIVAYYGSAQGSFYKD